MEHALNEWLERVEEQVNTLQDQINEKSNFTDLQQLELKIQMEVRERAFQDEQIVQLAQNSERLCTRLAEDAIT